MATATVETTKQLPRSSVLGDWSTLLREKGVTVKAIKKRAIESLDLSYASAAERKFLFILWAILEAPEGSDQISTARTLAKCVPLFALTDKGKLTLASDANGLQPLFQKAVVHSSVAKWMEDLKADGLETAIRYRRKGSHQKQAENKYPVDDLKAARALSKWEAIHDDLSLLIAVAEADFLLSTAEIKELGLSYNEANKTIMLASDAHKKGQDLDSLCLRLKSRRQLLADKDKPKPLEEGRVVNYQFSCPPSMKTDIQRRFKEWGDKKQSDFYRRCVSWFCSLDEGKRKAAIAAAELATEEQDRPGESWKNGGIIRLEKEQAEQLEAVRPEGESDTDLGRWVVAGYLASN